jgi:hypothetical protein
MALADDDRGVTTDTIAGEFRFSKHVANIVIEVADEKSLPKADRKRMQVEPAGHKSREAKTD